MSSLTAADKQYLEAILGMGGGFVLDFSDNTFDEFFGTYGVDSHGGRYQKYGTSKAKKMRAFWEKEPDSLVGPVLSGMLDIYEAQCALGRATAILRCSQRVRRLFLESQEERRDHPTQTWRDS